MSHAPSGPPSGGSGGIAADLHREYKPAANWLQFRRVLVDWMCEAGDEFNLKLSTMHVSVMLLDRILHNTSVTRNKLQLVAIACISSPVWHLLL